MMPKDPMMPTMTTSRKSKGEQAAANARDPSDDGRANCGAGRGVGRPGRYSRCRISRIATVHRRPATGASTSAISSCEHPAVVAVYLDANVLWPWRSFTEPDRLALSIVAHQIGQEVLIPEVAAEEAESHYRRSLEDAVENFERAGRDLNRLFGRDFAYDPRADPVAAERHGGVARTS
jgi:hypothetical protein